MSHQRALELARDGMKPFDISAFLGIGVNFLPFKNIKGIAMSLDSHKLILINEGLTELEKQLVCGHELGHFLFHEEANFMFILEKTYFYPKQEYQANLFGKSFSRRLLASSHSWSVKEKYRYLSM